MNANRLLRMILRFAMREGVNRGVDAWARRQSDQIDPNAPGAREMKAQTREQSGRIKRNLRMMRRFLRF